MPTVLEVNGVRMFFYSKEGNRIHIHLEYQGREAKVWVDTYEIAYNRGFNDFHLWKILKLVRKNEKKIKKAWEKHFGQRNR